MTRLTPLQLRVLVALSREDGSALLRPWGDTKSYELHEKYDAHGQPSGKMTFVRPALVDALFDAGFLDRQHLTASIFITSAGMQRLEQEG